MSSAPRGEAIRELVPLFLKLGIIGFGGPAAHIAMMEDEVVDRRGWIDRQRFLDLVGATNLIPGPNSTEMALHVGFLRAGWPGMLAAGASFLIPAVSLMTGLAWLYVQYGTVPEVVPFLVGIKPAVIAVILAALWRLGKTAVKGVDLAVIGALVAGGQLIGLSPIVVLLAGGVGGALWIRLRDRIRDAGGVGAWLAALVPASGSASGGLGLLQAGTGAGATGTGSVPLTQLALFFLKVGAVLYGSGYVLVAFLEGDLVQGYGWLTQQQLLDAVAMGQFTPGPVLTTATFIGYLLANWQGALVATLAIFLPSFLFVAVLNPIVPRLRESAWTAAFLDAVNVSAVGLMLAVTISLGMGAITGWRPAVIAAGSAIAVLGFRVNAAVIVIGGAVAGWLLAGAPV